MYKKKMQTNDANFKCHIYEAGEPKVIEENLMDLFREQLREQSEKDMPGGLKGAVQKGKNFVQGVAQRVKKGLNDFKNKAKEANDAWVENDIRFNQGIYDNGILKRNKQVNEPNQQRVNEDKASRSKKRVARALYNKLETLVFSGKEENKEKIEQYFDWFERHPCGGRLEVLIKLLHSDYEQYWPKVYQHRVRQEYEDMVFADANKPPYMWESKLDSIISESIRKVLNEGNKTIK